jgi:hypothetical protein
MLVGVVFISLKYYLPSAQNQHGSYIEKPAKKHKQRSIQGNLRTTRTVDATLTMRQSAQPVSRQLSQNEVKTKNSQTQKDGIRAFIYKFHLLRNILFHTECVTNTKQGKTSGVI